MDGCFVIFALMDGRKKQYAARMAALWFSRSWMIAKANLQPWMAASWSSRSRMSAHN